MRTIAWKEFSQHGDSSSLWTLIHGKVYDVTSFLSTHPGGDQLLAGGAKESTALFLSMHVSSTVATHVLPKYQIGVIDESTVPADQHQYTFTDPFYTELRASVDAHFKRNKMSRHDPWQLYLKFVTTFAGFWLSWYCVMLRGWWLACPLMGWFVAQIGIQVMHDGNHGAFSKYWAVNKITGLCLDFVGGSNLVWREEHNLGHHIHTNNHNDPDTMSGFPYIRFHPTADHKWWHAYQQYYAWVVYAIVAPRWYFQDLVLYFTLPVEQRIHPLALDKVMFWLMKAVYPIWMIYIPSLYLGSWSLPIYLYFASTTFSSYCFALQFAVTHISADAEFPEEKEGGGSKIPATRDWATLQVTTSTNYSTSGDSSWLATWFSGGLNYQIEHHLFPSIAHPYYPQIAPLVQAACKKHGIPYNSHHSWWAAACSHYDHLYRMGVRPSDKRSHSRFVGLSA